MKQCVRAEIVVPYMAIHGDTWQYMAIHGRISRYIATRCNTSNSQKLLFKPQLCFSKASFYFAFSKVLFYFWSPTSSTFFKKENTNDSNHPFNHQLFTSHSHNRRLGTHSKIAREALCISACKVNVHTLIVCVCTHITPMQPRAWCTSASSWILSAISKCASSVQQINTYL